VDDNVRGDTFGGRQVAEFRETNLGSMPDTEEWAAIKRGDVRASKTFPDAGAVRFVAYRLWGEARFAIVRILFSGFDVPPEHRRFIVEAFLDYESASSAYPLAVGWLTQLVQQYGPQQFGAEWERKAEEWARQTEGDPR
jgi:hypothetical protein